MIRQVFKADLFSIYTLNSFFLFFFCKFVSSFKFYMEGLKNIHLDHTNIDMWWERLFQPLLSDILYRIGGIGEVSCIVSEVSMMKSSQWISSSCHICGTSGLLAWEIQVCVCICIDVYVCVYIFVFVYVYVYIYICMCMCMCMCCLYVCEYVVCVCAMCMFSAILCV